MSMSMIGLAGMPGTEDRADVLDLVSHVGHRRPDVDLDGLEPAGPFRVVVRHHDLLSHPGRPHVEGALDAHGTQAPAEPTPSISPASHSAA